MTSILGAFGVEDGKIVEIGSMKYFGSVVRVRKPAVAAGAMEAMMVIQASL